ERRGVSPPVSRTGGLTPRRSWKALQAIHCVEPAHELAELAILEVLAAAVGQLAEERGVMGLGELLAALGDVLGERVEAAGGEEEGQAMVGHVVLDLRHHRADRGGAAEQVAV